MSLYSSYNFLGTGGTVTAAAADFTLANHTINISGGPSLDYRKAASAGLYGSLKETVYVSTLTPTAANSTEFSFIITQKIAPGVITTRLITTTTAASGGTATTICNAFRAAIALYDDLQITATGTTTLILTANTGYPLFTVSSVGAGTIAVANSMSTKTVTSSTDATPIVVTSAAHGFVAGNTVVITGGNLSLAPYNGTKLRISAATTNTFTLEGTVGDSSGAGSAGTITLQAQESKGYAADLLAQGITGYVSGQTYSQIAINYQQTAPADLMGNVEAAPITHTLYINEAATNYAALQTRIGEIVQAYNPSATTSNPEAIALG